MPPVLPQLSWNKASRDPLHYFSPGFIISERVGGADQKGPNRQSPGEYKQAEIQNRHRTEERVSTAPLCFTDFHGRTDGFPPKPGVYCILCQLKGMSQHHPPPLFPIHFYCSSTTLLTPFKAEKNLKHNLNSKAHFSIWVTEVCSGVWRCLTVAFSSDFLSRPVSRWGNRCTLICDHCAERIPGRVDTQQILVESMNTGMMSFRTVDTRIPKMKRPPSLHIDNHRAK